MRLLDFVCPYRVGIECEKECKIILNGEEMEEVNEFKYLGSVMCKHSGTEGEARERAFNARKKGGRVFGTYHEWQKCEHGGEMHGKRGRRRSSSSSKRRRDAWKERKEEEEEEEKEGGL